MEDENDKEGDELIVDSQGKANDHTISSAYCFESSTKCMERRLTCEGQHQTRERRHRPAGQQLLPLKAED